MCVQLWLTQCCSRAKLLSLPLRATGAKLGQIQDQPKDCRSETLKQGREPNEQYWWRMLNNITKRHLTAIRGKISFRSSKNLVVHNMIVSPTFLIVSAQFPIVSTQPIKKEKQRSTTRLLRYKRQSYAGLTSIKQPCHPPDQPTLLSPHPHHHHSERPPYFPTLQLAPKSLPLQVSQPPPSPH